MAGRWPRRVVHTVAVSPDGPPPTPTTTLSTGHGVSLRLDDFSSRHPIVPAPETSAVSPLVFRLLR